MWIESWTVLFKRSINEGTQVSRRIPQYGIDFSGSILMYFPPTEKLRRHICSYLRWRVHQDLTYDDGGQEQHGGGTFWTNPRLLWRVRLSRRQCDGYMV